jgi:hypothetical protein
MTHQRAPPNPSDRNPLYRKAFNSNYTFGTGTLEGLLPSCAVVTDVTPAAVAGLNTMAVPLLDTQTRLNDLREGIPFDTLRPKMSPKDVRRPVQTFISNNPSQSDSPGWICTRTAYAADLLALR